LFVLILHVPSLSFVRPKIFLNTFLSNTINPLHAELDPSYHLLALLRAHHIFHVSGLRVNLFFYGFFQDPYFTGICYYWSYDTPVQFQFWFLGDQSTFKEKLVCVICFISKCYSILDLFFCWVITCNWESNHVNAEWVTTVHYRSKT
jgi:hypothetical protein